VISDDDIGAIYTAFSGSVGVAGWLVGVGVWMWVSHFGLSNRSPAISI
jgi:hypothetical protein